MRYTPILLVAVPVLALTGAACAPAEEAQEPAAEAAATTEADVEAINGVREQEVAAALAGDTEGFLAILTGDAVMMPPNEPAIAGSEAIHSWFEAFWETLAISQLTYTSTEITVTGDWAIENFKFEWTLTPVAGGEPTSDYGKGIHIYRRQPDGSWKISFDIWNSDKPLPGGE